MDEAAKGKLGPEVIGGVLRNSDGLVLAAFSKNVGILESIEAEVLPILEALCLFKLHYNAKVIVESDLINAVS